MTLRDTLSGFRCPACDAVLPHAQMGPLVKAAIDERSRATDTCRACRETFHLVPAPATDELRAVRYWGSLAIACILFGLAVFAGLSMVLPPWAAAVPALAAGFGPLPYLEALLLRLRATVKPVTRKRGPSAPGGNAR